MTDKQPEALRLAAWLKEGAWHQMRLGDVEAAGRELIRQNAAIERKDALLRQALEAIAHGCPPDCKDGSTDSGGTYPWGEAVLMWCPTCETFESIKKELSQ